MKRPLMKRCSTCQKEKLVSEFNRNRAKVDGLSTFCRDCSHKQFSAYYQINKVHHRQLVMKRKAVVRAEHQRLLMELLSTRCCVDCGESDPIVLDFDHVRGVKQSGIAEMLISGTSWKKILAEIAKCEVRCANCHRRKSARESRSHRWRFING